MIDVHYPEPKFRTRKEEGKPYLFDPLRKIWLLLTEEEWVRQNFVNYLVTCMHYPAAYMALEKEIMLHDLKKRFDILIYNREHHPWMLVECKAPQINLNDAVLQQVLRYNITVPVSFIVITNGNSTMAWEKGEGRLEPIERLPVFGK